MPKSEERIQAFRWKLGLPGAGENTDDMRRIWEALTRDDAEYRVSTTNVASRLGRLLALALRYKMTGQAAPNYEWVNSLADVFIEWVVKNERSISPKLAGELRAVLDPGQPAVGRPPLPPSAMQPPPLPPGAPQPPPVAKPAAPPKGRGQHPAGAPLWNAAQSMDSSGENPVTPTG